MPSSFDRMLGPKRRVLLAYPEAFDDILDPQAAELNNAAMVFNITCALLESDTTIGLDDPDTDDELTMCSIGNEQTPTFDNVNITLTGLRDGRRETTEVAGVLWNLLKEKGVPFVLIDSVGYDADVPFAAGQEIDYYLIETDFPGRTINDRESIKITSVPKFRGELSIRHEIAA